MYLLSCPNCQTGLTITPAQAGDTLSCPNCDSLVNVPKLGEIRQLPRSESEESPATKAKGSSMSAGATVAFVLLSGIAVLAFIVAGYSTVRWANINPPITNDEFLARMEEDYKVADAAQLVREFEDMEKYSMDLIHPYQFQQQVDKKNRWGLNALIAAGIMLACGGGALTASIRGRNE